MFAVRSRTVATRITVWLTILSASFGWIVPSGVCGCPVRAALAAEGSVALEAPEIGSSCCCAVPVESAAAPDTVAETVRGGDCCCDADRPCRCEPRIELLAAVPSDRVERSGDIDVAVPPEAEWPRLATDHRPKAFVDGYGGWVLDADDRCARLCRWLK